MVMAISLIMEAIVWVCKLIVKVIMLGIRAEEGIPIWARDTPMSPEERITISMGALDSLLGQQRRASVSRGEMGVLGLLSQCGTTSPTNLAESLNVTTARIANTLKTLERKGFVRRKTNPKDRRGVIVTIPPEGRRYGKEQYGAAVADTRDLLAALTEDERSQLADLAERLVASAAEKRGVALPPSPMQGLDHPA